MRNSYEEMINILHKKEAVPNEIFNKVIFSIQNNQEKQLAKKPTSIMVVLSPLLTSFIVVVMFLGINGINIRKASEGEFLLKVYDQGYSDKYILNINEEFIF